MIDSSDTILATYYFGNGLQGAGETYEVSRSVAVPGNIRPEASTTAIPRSRSEVTARDRRGVGTRSRP